MVGIIGGKPIGSLKFQTLNKQVIPPRFTTTIAASSSNVILL